MTTSATTTDELELREACEANDIARVRELFAIRPLDARNAIACSCTTSPGVPLMRCLLEHGAEIARYLRAKPPPSLDMVKLFVEFGYDVKAEGHKMLQDFAHDREALDWLMDHGADASRTDDTRDDDYPLHRRLIGARNYSLKVLDIIAASGDIPLFDHLVSRGADPHRSMALHRAGKCPDPEKSIAMIDHLLDKHHMNLEALSEDLRRTVNSIDSGTPLNCAVLYRNLAAIKHFLKRGANPNFAVNRTLGALGEGPSPFLPALEPLLNAGIDPDDALKLVIRTNDIQAARSCVAAGAHPRVAISSQEARAARLAARSEPHSDDKEEYYDDDHPSDMDSDAGWNNEMEVLLRSFDYAGSSPCIP